MKGPQSVKPLYKKIFHMHPFRYQCSEQSTDNEIEATFQSAMERQKTFEGDQPEKCTARSVVLLDEAGLPKEDEHSLKVIHYHLDHPHVSTVILSNEVLDAAKTNRALLLLQSGPSTSDLQELSKGCIFGTALVSPRNSCILAALCQSFKEVNKYTSRTKENMFHLRDFVYLLRYLRKACAIGTNDANCEYAHKPF